MGSRGVLEVKEVDVWRQARCLIRGLSFTLEAGQQALLVGPNGAGKTSLLRILAGLAPCTVGQLTWNSIPIGALSATERAAIVYRGHLDGLKKELTVEENLEFWARLRGQPLEFDALLAELGLRTLAARQVRYLSAGQRRRAGLATLAVAAARLWLLDEPMTHLDAAGREIVARWIQAHRRNGGIAVVATHEPEVLKAPGTLLVEL